MKIITFSLFLILSGEMLAQWNASPAVNSAIALQLYDQQDARIVTDGKGGAILAWLDYRNDPAQSTGDIYSQRIDKNGFVKWIANGLTLCNLATDQASPSMTEDGQGGAIVAWNDWRNGDRDIYAQRIDSSGNLVWSSGGVAVVAKTYHQQDPKLIYDGTGGAIIVWQDSVPGAYDIYAQRISSSGTALWTTGGVAVCTSLFEQINPKIETDGSGGVIITWQDKRNAADYDIYAQHLNASGVAQWTSNGFIICNAAGTQSNPKIEPDGAGGAYIGWQDKRNGSNYDIYGQHLDASGVATWTANGKGVAVAPGNQSALDMTSDGINGVFFSWKDDRNGTFDIFCQLSGTTGNMQFLSNGLAVNTAAQNQINPNVVGDGSGGAIIVWQDSSGGTWDVVSSRVNASGSIVWTTSVGTAAGNQTNPKSVADGSGGCIYSFQDKRSGSDFDIYAHHLYADGSANGIFEYNDWVQMTVFPNPFHDQTYLLFNRAGHRSAEDLRIFDMTGNNVASSFKRTPEGFLVDGSAFLPGIYIFEVVFRDGVISRGKMIKTE